MPAKKLLLEPTFSTCANVQRRAVRYTENLFQTRQSCLGILNWCHNMSGGFIPDPFSVVSHAHTGSTAPHEISVITVNRAPVLTLWAAVVASRQGYTWEQSLTIGQAIASRCAITKGIHLGIIAPATPQPKQQQPFLKHSPPSPQQHPSSRSQQYRHDGVQGHGSQQSHFSQPPTSPSSSQMSPSQSFQPPGLPQDDRPQASGSPNTARNKHARTRDDDTTNIPAPSTGMPATKLMKQHEEQQVHTHQEQQGTGQSTEADALEGSHQQAQSQQSHADALHATGQSGQYDEEDDMPAPHHVSVFGTAVKVYHEGGSLLACEDGGAKIYPARVEAYLQRSFGVHYPLCKEGLEGLAAQLAPDALAAQAFQLYEKIRPPIAPGKAGWGQKGLFDLSKVRALTQELKSINDALAEDWDG